MMRIASEFRFTPASRSRIATPTKSPRSLFDLMEDTSDAGGPQNLKRSENQERTNCIAKDNAKLEAIEKRFAYGTRLKPICSHCMERLLYFLPQCTQPAYVRYGITTLIMLVTPVLVPVDPVDLL